MLILLPPSEGKAQAGGDLAFAECHPELLAETKAVLKHVNSLSADARMKFFALKTKEKATACHALNQSALKAPVLPAVERYTGVVYQHLDYRTLKKKRAAEKRIFVVSGLFGVTGGGTKIPPYKMPINPWLIRYWKEINTNRLKKAASGKKVLSLLPQAYAKAIDLDDAISVDFRVQGGKKAAGHSGKAIKGRFVRFLIENNVTSKKDFAQFKENDFRFDGTNFVQL